LFLWLLGGVFQAFKQERLFTKKGFSQLSRFYSVNLTVPVLILIILAVLGQEVQDIIRITFLHLVIGVFAFFMAAIFKQGLFLQEEQDLIF
jgi:predicted permease